MGESQVETSSVSPDRDDEPRGVTTFELLFDLVFVFAVTQLARITVNGDIELLHACVLLPLVWFCWTSVAWLGNLGRADRGGFRVAVLAAMGSMFFMAVVLTRCFDGEHAGRPAAIVFTAGFVVVHLVSTTPVLTTIRAGRGAATRTAAVVAVSAALLVAGIIASASLRPWWWLGAVVAMLLGQATTPDVRWRVPEPGHFTERFGLVLLIALGENLVETGTRAAEVELTSRLGVALVSVLVVTVAQWWLYFDAFTSVAERVLATTDPARRARLARDGYAFAHLLMVGGIVATAAGTTLLVDAAGVRDTAGRWLLDGGAALYLTAHILFRVRAFGSPHVPRMLAVVALLGGCVALSSTDLLVQLWWPALVFSLLVGYELVAYRQWRHEVRSPDTETPSAPMRRR